MSKKVKKEIETTKIRLSKIMVEDGAVSSFEVPYVTLIGKYSDKQIYSMIAKKYHGENVVVLSIERETNTYEMDLTKFILNSTIVQEIVTEKINENEGNV